MWVCSLKCYGPLAILLLWIYVYPLVVGIEESRQQRRDASPDSITDIKIRKADQIPLGKVHFGEEGGAGRGWELEEEVLEDEMAMCYMLSSSLLLVVAKPQNDSHWLPKKKFQLHVKIGIIYEIVYTEVLKQSIV